MIVALQFNDSLDLKLVIHEMKSLEPQKQEHGSSATSTNASADRLV